MKAAEKVPQREYLSLFETVEALGQSSYALCLRALRSLTDKPNEGALSVLVLYNGDHNFLIRSGLVYRHHTATQRGYVSRKREYMDTAYEGRFGCGFIRHTPDFDSTRHHPIAYYIFDAEYIRAVLAAVDYEIMRQEQVKEHAD
jgi:hypothetical protein